MKLYRCNCPCGRLYYSFNGGNYTYDGKKCGFIASVKEIHEDTVFMDEEGLPFQVGFNGYRLVRRHNNGEIFGAWGEIRVVQHV